jgi:LysR family nitrogen assimilation transcriptional regulator
MDLRQLRYFLEVAETKSITRASDNLHVAQPALGLQIRKLEDELGVQLFYRHSRGVEATEAGMVLYEEAKDLLARAKQTADRVRDLSGAPRGRVAVGTTPSVNAMLAGRLVRRCTAALPDVSLVLLEDLSQNLLELLQVGRLDVSFAHYICSPSGLHLDALATEELYFIRPAEEGDPRQAVELTEVASRRLILPSARHALRQMVEERAAREGLELDVQVEVHSSTTMCELVEQGVGCTILPYGLVASYVKRGTLVAQRVVNPSLIRTMYLVTLAARPLNRAEAAVVDTIKTLVEEEIAAHSLSWKRPNQ